MLVRAGKPGNVSIRTRFACVLNAVRVAAVLLVPVACALCVSFSRADTRSNIAPRAAKAHPAESPSTKAQDSEAQAEAQYYKAETAEVDETVATSSGVRGMFLQFGTLFGSVIVAALAGIFALVQFGPTYRLSVQTQRDSLLFEAAKRLTDPSSLQGRVSAAMLLVALDRRASPDYRDSILHLLLAGLEAERDHYVITALQNSIAQIAVSHRAEVIRAVTHEYVARNERAFAFALAAYMKRRSQGGDKQWEIDAIREASELTTLTEGQLRSFIGSDQYKNAILVTPSSSVAFDELTADLRATGRRLVVISAYREIMNLQDTERGSK
jgi:hypothetical protein